MMNDLTSALLWVLVMGGFTVYALRKEARRPKPTSCPEQVSHVRLAGVTRRCVGCGRLRPTMDLADGWRGPALPYCAPCIRDTIGVEDAEGEVVA